MAIFAFIRWSRKKTPMTTDVCSGCVSSPETLQTCCKMILLPLSICFCRYGIKIERKLFNFSLEYTYVCLLLLKKGQYRYPSAFWFRCFCQLCHTAASSAVRLLYDSCCKSTKPAFSLSAENTAFLFQSCQGVIFLCVWWWMCVFPECWGCAAGAICSWDEVQHCIAPGCPAHAWETG